MARLHRLLVAGLVPLTLQACNSENPTTLGGPGSVIRSEAACAVEGLTKPLRQTLILVDAKALTKASDGAGFARDNPAFRDLVLSIADPARALPGGISGARERVVIAVVPSDGSAAQTTFSGCIPGMSDAELAVAREGETMVSKTFSSGIARQLEDQAETFRTQLIGGMVAAAARADGMPAAQTGSVAQSPFLAGVRASRGLFENPAIVQRLVLVSDLGGLTLPAGDAEATRSAGFEQGRRAGGDLGRADVHVVLPAGANSAGRDFFQAFFLAQEGRLASYDAGKVSAAAGVPIRLWQMTGQAAYPSKPELIDVRIGEDARGKLTGSWLTTLGEPRFPIPLEGQIACAGDVCKIVSDNSGFAQRWSNAPGDPPEFRNDMPFGGMRSFAFDLARGKLTGRVFDVAVYVGDDRNRNGVDVTASAK